MTLRGAVKDAEGRLWVPATPPRASVDARYQAEHGLTGLGQVQAVMNTAGPKEPLADTLARHFTVIPNFYTVSIELGSDDGATNSNSAPLRPEPFVCTRITWCTTGDVPKYLGEGVTPGSSLQGRVVEASWEDEFTKFLGNRPCLLSALFGDSNGYLDITKGVLLAGKQTLSVTLRRITWPTDVDTPPASTRFDICFMGLGLLPKGVNQSGSAG